MVQAEDKSANKLPPIEHTSPFRISPEKFSSVIQIRTIRDVTQPLVPHKRN